MDMYKQTIRKPTTKKIAFPGNPRISKFRSRNNSLEFYISDQGRSLEWIWSISFFSVAYVSRGGGLITVTLPLHNEYCDVGLVLDKERKGKERKGKEIRIKGATCYNENVMCRRLWNLCSIYGSF